MAPGGSLDHEEDSGVAGGLGPTNRRLDNPGSMERGMSDIDTVTLVSSIIDMVNSVVSFHRAPLQESKRCPKEVA